MPKLLQINSCVNAGSTGRIAEDIGQVVMNAGWESYIAYARDYRHSASQTIKIGNKLSFYLHVLKSRLFDRQGFGSYFATKKLIRQIDKIKPDVIQLHNIHGYYLNLPILLKYISQKNIPLFWCLHDCWSMTGHCSHFALQNCNKWETECHDCPLLGDYPKSWFVDSSRRNFNEKNRLIKAIPNLTLISSSNWMASIIRRSYMKDREVVLIPNGIDTNVFKPRTNGEILRKKYGIQNKFVIMASGTVWLPYKGLNDFGLLRKMLSDDFAIILVGMSKEDLKTKLPDGVIGIERTKSPEELSEFYSMADCVMSLSRLESFGLTPVEGFACGTPAIVYNCTSTPELITPETGFVAEVGNIADVKQKVELIKERGKSYYSKRCREIALEKYDRNVCYHKYLSLYNSAINTKCE